MAQKTAGGNSGALPHLDPGKTPEVRGPARGCSKASGKKSGLCWPFEGLRFFSFGRGIGVGGLGDLGGGRGGFVGSTFVC